MTNHPATTPSLVNALNPRPDPDRRLYLQASPDGPWACQPAARRENCGLVLDGPTRSKKVAMNVENFVIRWKAFSRRCLRRFGRLLETENWFRESAIYAALP